MANEAIWSKVKDFSSQGRIDFAKFSLTDFAELHFFECCTTFLFRMGHPRPLFRSFSISSNTNRIDQFLQVNVKNDPSSIRYMDSNSRPLALESPPITTALAKSFFTSSTARLLLGLWVSTNSWKRLHKHVHVARSRFCEISLLWLIIIFCLFWG